MCWSGDELEREAIDRERGVTRTVSVNRKALEAQRRKRMAAARAQWRKQRRSRV
jgi:hypothetical protein